MLTWWNSNRGDLKPKRLQGSVVQLWEKDPSVTSIGNNGLENISFQAISKMDPMTKISRLLIGQL